jgi:hypothetical protein
MTLDHITWVEAPSASRAEGCRDVVACEGPADQAATRHAFDSVGAWNSRIGLLGIRGGKLQKRLRAKGKQFVVCALADVLSAAGSAYTEALLDVRDGGLEVRGCIDDVVDPHHDPQP